MRSNWKLITLITACLVVLALVGIRTKRAFAPNAPAMLNYAQHTSPGFLFDSDLRHSWKNVAALLDASQREEKAALRKLADVTFVHICRLPNETILWDTIEARNPGFESMSRLERNEPGPPAQLIGYYTFTGKPLAFDTKVDLRNKAQTLTTVDLEAPLAGNAAVKIFRVLRTTSRVTSNTAGNCILRVGRLSESPSTFNALGVGIPKPAKLEKYTPTTAHVAAGTECDVVTWLSSRVDDANRGVQITFTIPK